MLVSNQMLEVVVSGIKMKNPLILASGILGTTASLLTRISRYAGAVVTKSTTIERREGYETPVIAKIECGFINAVGLSNPSAEHFSEELREYRGNAPLVISLAGDEESLPSLPGYFPYSSGFEINLSCPHVKGIGAELGSDPDTVRDVCKAVRKATDKPVWVKLSPNVKDIVEIGKSAEEGGADAVVAINTLRGLSVDVETGTALLSNVYGGISGKAIKPVALKCVYDLFRELSIPVIGCGGISTWKDAVEFMMVGASAVQIGSAVSKNLRVFCTIQDGLRDYLVRKKITLDELIGMAHRR